MKSLFAGLLITTLILSGCGRSSSHNGDSEVLAEINDYKLTAGDFKETARVSNIETYYAKDADSAKTALLDELITRNVLIQEAQKYGIDKEKDFMKEIERYWQQTLLKLMIQRKIAEIASDIVITDEEVQKEYLKQKREVLAEIVVLDSLDAAEQLSADASDFEGAKASVMKNLVRQPWKEWWSPGDLPLDVEAAVFRLEPGEVSAPIKIGDTWIVVKVIDQRQREIDTFDKAEAPIREELKRRKQEIRLDAWIEGLKDKSSIIVYEDVLDGVEIK